MCQVLDLPPPKVILVPAPIEAIIQQLGGDSQFNYLLMTFCEFIEEDVKLKSTILQGMELELLLDAVRNLVRAALETPVLDAEAQNKLVLKSYPLFELGINNLELFTKLEIHFKLALHQCWVEGDLLNECMQRFGALRPIFEEEGLEMERIAIENKIVVLRILLASATISG